MKKLFIKANKMDMKMLNMYYNNLKNNILSLKEELFEKFDLNFNELQNIVSDYNYVIEKGNTNISVINIKNIQTMLHDIQINFSMLGYQEY